MDQKIVLAETLKALERVEQVIIDEIRSANEFNEVLTEALGEARISILKISYKFNMERSKKNGLCRRSARGNRDNDRRSSGGSDLYNIENDQADRRAMFGRRSNDDTSISHSRQHKPMFGG